MRELNIEKITHLNCGKKWVYDPKSGQTHDNKKYIGLVLNTLNNIYLFLATE